MSLFRADEKVIGFQQNSTFHMIWLHYCVYVITGNRTGEVTNGERYEIVTVIWNAIQFLWVSNLWK